MRFDRGQSESQTLDAMPSAPGLWPLWSLIALAAILLAAGCLAL